MPVTICVGGAVPSRRAESRRAPTARRFVRRERWPRTRCCFVRRKIATSAVQTPDRRDERDDQDERFMMYTWKNVP